MERSSLSNPTKCRGIGARITQVRSRITQGKFADSLGIHKNTLIRYEKEERLPDSEVLTLLYKIYGVDPTWLLTGESKLPAVAEDLVFSSDYIPVAGYCPSTHEIDTEGPIAVKRSWVISELQIEPEDLRLLYVEGESMKSTLFPGDIVLTNLKDTIVRDGIYVVHIEDALIIKRLQRLSGNVIKVISDNSMYESWTANLKDSTHKLTIVGRVVWACRKI
ncbi:MAG: S24 family peptidase [Gloeobacterales cyanobacterium]